MQLTSDNLEKFVHVQIVEINGYKVLKIDLSENSRRKVVSHWTKRKIFWEKDSFTFAHDHSLPFLHIHPGHSRSLEFSNLLTDFCSSNEHLHLCKSVLPPLSRKLLSARADGMVHLINSLSPDNGRAGSVL